MDTKIRKCLVCKKDKDKKREYFKRRHKICIECKTEKEQLSLEGKIRCSRCSEIKTNEQFYRPFRRFVCKSCDNIRGKELKLKNPSKHREINKKASLKYYKRNKKYRREYYRKSYLANPEKYILKSAKTRAKQYNLPFNIEESDIIIPEFCPVLGIKLQFNENGFQDSSPSLDKIIPKLGYVKGNVRIISWKANRIKNDGNADEHLYVSKYIQTHIESTVEYSI